ncbi:MAG: hypothetical protein JRJ48_02385 [Deltaproteobacteria bacterium]|nr:hypothetical protein [Deltaproteobacteria bacterium]
MREKEATACGLAGFGFYLPEKEVSVHELAERAGIPKIVADFAGARTVREAAEDELPSEMAIKAAREALRDAGMDAEQIDLIIYCGAGLPDYIIPQTSGKIQHAIGAARAFAFDLVQGCSGMLSALQVAKGYIALNEGIDTVLLVSGDKWSQFTRHHAADSVFFGDGGGAVIVQRGCPDFQLLCFNIITNGEYYDLWRIETGGIKHPITEEALAQGLHYYDCYDKKRAHGPFKDLYVPTIVRGVRGALEKCGLTSDDVAYFDMVNANLKVLEIVAENLGIPREQTSAEVLERFGHFGAFDIFFNLQQALSGDKIKKGDIIVMQSTGVGFTWACGILRY